MLNRQPCEIPARVIYNDTLMYVVYNSIVEEYKVKKITKDRKGELYIMLDNGLCFINKSTTYISVNKGKHEIILKPLLPTDLHNLLDKNQRKLKKANAT